MTRHRSDPPLPRRLAGRFDLHAPLGVGGTATVWRAYDRRERGWVALKLLGPEAAALCATEQRLRSTHPHLLTPIEQVEDAGTIALVSPLLRGGTLRELLVSDPPAPAVAIDLLAQLLDALSAVHDAGWVHRDVKPGNLLLERRPGGGWHLRLGDFGIACRTGSPVARAEAPGTPGFVAPETARDHRAAPAQDLYAVGVVAGLLLGPGEPPELARWRSPDPAARPASAGLARAELLALDRGPRVSQRPHATTPSPTGWSTTASWAVPVALAVGTAALTALLR